MYARFLLGLGILGFAICCDSPSNLPTTIADSPSPCEIERLIVVSIDGPRYSETWGHVNQRHIPYMAKELAPQGVLYTQFFNEGLTLTMSGHNALLSGHYEALNNEGHQWPSSPSWLKHYLKTTGKPSSKAYLIAGKRKLLALQDCQDPLWRNQYNPHLDASNRSDSATFAAALQILDEDTPDLAMIHFREVDAHGHANDWDAYIASIEETDAFMSELWKFLNTHPYYRDKTALWITHDHGRHLLSNGGFRHHGDKCEGCRRISLLALSPCIPRGLVVDRHAELIDIFPTISTIFGFETEQGKGEVLLELIP
ncbi:MAG: alkaline phosphatase family protein [Bacteroidota bacterium]